MANMKSDFNNQKENLRANIAQNTFYSLPLLEQVSKDCDL